MEESQRKEQFSRAYVRAIASVAGFTVSEPEVDDDSVDLTLSASGRRLLGRPRLDLQLKATALDVLKADGVHFPLAIKNVDDLRADDVLVPRILVVLTLPEEIEDWLEHSESELAMRHCAYWVSLRGRESSGNTSTETIVLPREQVFSPEQLTSIMRRIGAGGLP